MNSVYCSSWEDYDGFNVIYKCELVLQTFADTHQPQSSSAGFSGDRKRSPFPNQHLSCDQLTGCFALLHLRLPPEAGILWPPLYSCPVGSTVVNSWGSGVHSSPVIQGLSSLKILALSGCVFP